jgi:hypothetical protein
MTSLGTPAFEIRTADGNSSKPLGELGEGKGLKFVLAELGRQGWK